MRKSAPVWVWTLFFRQYPQMFCLIPTEMLSPPRRRSTIIPHKLFRDYLNASGLFSSNLLPLSSYPGALSSLNIPAGLTSGAKNAFS
jgi:hypothetical protein